MSGRYSQLTKVLGNSKNKNSQLKKNGHMNQKKKKNKKHVFEKLAFR